MIDHAKWLPPGGGEMGERIRRFDWDSHPLGRPEHWPAALHAALGICLHSSFPTAIYWGPDLRLLYNDAWAFIPGDRHPEALGQPAAEVWTDIWAVVGPQLEQVVEQAQGFTTYDQMLPMQREGRPEETYWNYSFSPILGPDGEVAGVFNQGHETTDRVFSARERQAEMARLKDLFTQAPGAIAVLRGPNHKVEIANHAYIDLIGASGSILGEEIAHVLPGVVDQGFIDLMNKVYETGEAFRGTGVPIELGRNGRAETRLLDFVYQPTRDLAERVDGIFVEAWDVTERHQLLEDLKQLNATLEQRVQDAVAERMATEDQLRQAQKMEALGQLTGGIAHDFNNMMAVVISALNLMKRRLAEGEIDMSRYMDAAADGAQRAAGLTRRLLAFSRQQPLEPGRIDTSTLLPSLVELLGRTLGEHIRISTRIEEGVWPTFADRVQLESAILNLAVNARDAMPSGGRLTISASNAKVREEASVALPLQAGDYVLIALEDTGTGMPAEVIERAFDPFFTTKAVGKGTGLGLSQVFGFARQSGGHVALRSRPEVGTTAEIYLPRCLQEELRSTEDRPVELAPVAKHTVILVVEDDARVRSFSVEALRELGFTTISAENGAQALHMLQAGERPDLIFTDVVMPEMSGPELSDAARQLIPGIRTLYTTGYTRDSLISGEREIGAAEILAKPFTLEELAEKVHSALSKPQADTERSAGAGSSS